MTATFRQLVTLLLAATAHAYPEYRQELPSIPAVSGLIWQGVGHDSPSGGGSANQFGRDFAAAKHTWTKELCNKDSDGDGYSNGMELGDPDCKWQQGQPSPTSTHTISHPGLKQSVPQLLKQPSVPPTGDVLTPARGLPPNNASPGSDAMAEGQSVPASSDPATTAPVQTVEPHADMPIPQGSERNLNGDNPQRWCQERHAAAAMPAGNDTPSVLGRRVGSNQEWFNVSLPPMVVLGTPDFYSCHIVHVPDSIPADREFVGVRVGLDGAAHLHHILLMECPADFWFLRDSTRNSEMCMTHSGSMFSACNRWWIATEANNDYQMCTPPGLIFGRAGEMRANNKVLVMQVHWVFGAKLQNKSVTLQDASVNFLHEDPPKDYQSEIMETASGSVPYPPSLLQHVNGLVIPGMQEAYTSSYECARRCTYIPLGGLSPKPVTLAGYTFHGHHFMTGMRMSIKRCPLTRLPDVSWEVTDWQQSVVHPTYNTMDQNIQLHPGDQLSWACTYNTSGVNRTVYGGYAGYSEEMCIMLLHYYPRNAVFRGCSAVTAEQGGHSLCMFEGTEIMAWQSSEADTMPVRTILSPRTLPTVSNGQLIGLTSGYKATIVFFWLLVIISCLWGLCWALGRCRWLGALHTTYKTSSIVVKRNIPVYIVQIVVDTVILATWVEPMFATWCGCTESGSHYWLIGFGWIGIVVIYALELVWRARLGAMLAVHHVASIFISIFLGEMSAEIYRFPDAIMLLGVFALLEQPTFVALLLMRVLPEGSVHTVRAWKAAVWFWFGSKTLSVVMAAVLIARDWRIMPDWVKGVYTAVWIVMYGVQIWSGFSQLAILRGVCKKYKQQTTLLGLLGVPPESPNANVDVELCDVGNQSKHALQGKDVERTLRNAHQQLP